MKNHFLLKYPSLMAFSVAIFGFQADAQTILIDDDFESGTLESWTAEDLAAVFDDRVGATQWATSGDFAVELRSRPGGTITLTEPLPLATQGYTSVTISYNLKFLSPSSTRRTFVRYAADGLNFVNVGEVRSLSEGQLSYTLNVGATTMGYDGSPFTDQAKFQIRFYDSGTAPRAYLDDVLITGIPEFAGSSGPLEIRDFSYAPESDEVTLTWVSQVGKDYVVRYSDDLLDWSGVIGGMIPASEGKSTTAVLNLAELSLEEASKLFFKVELVSAE